MINKLINMDIPPISNSNKYGIFPYQNKSVYTIQDYANSFINGMGETQRDRFKKMLQNGIECGISVADNYGIDYNEFIQEVKKQMEVS